MDEIGYPASVENKRAQNESALGSTALALRSLAEYKCEYDADEGSLEETEGR